MLLSVRSIVLFDVFIDSGFATAHTAAYDRARILHRDISAANILITDSGSGMLIDWDLSKEIKDNDENSTRYSRTVGSSLFPTHERLIKFAFREHGSSYRYHVYLILRLDPIESRMTLSRFSGSFFIKWSNSAIPQG